MAGIFREFIENVEPVKLREPFAETLGAFNVKDAVLEYTFAETVKMAGHICPTVTAAYMGCAAALKALYPGETPVRGDISITVYGEPDEGVYGVMGQVFTFLTGAAPLSGFRGIFHKFKRKDLLRFTREKPSPEALSFKFGRTDTDGAVMLELYPARVPFPPEKAARMSNLMEKVIWDAADDAEAGELKQLWGEKVRGMLEGGEASAQWLKIERM